MVRELIDERPVLRSTLPAGRGTSGLVLAVVLVSLIAFVLYVFGIAPAAAQPAPGVPSRGPRPDAPSETSRALTEEEIRQQELGEVIMLYRTGQHTAVIERVEKVAPRQPQAPRVLLLLVAAESRLALGQTDEALRSFETALSLARSLNNVEQRRFAWAHFRTAGLLREQKRFDAAIARLESGLQLEPQNVLQQILLGELYRERGDPHRALRQFRDLAGSSLPTNEERAVLRVKIARLVPSQKGVSETPPDMRSARIHPDVSIGLVALNQLPASVVLPDLCVVLESKWLIRCEVLPPLTIPDDDILVVERGQYDGERVLEALKHRLPVPTRPLKYVVAIAGRDLFGPQTNYVFSWQQRGQEAGLGVLSAYRFTTGIPDFYEPHMVAMRRLAIQALSTTGSMLGFSRSTLPDCPMAYPHDFREFQQKRSKLCESTVQERDALLTQRGGAAVPFGTARSADVGRVYRAYALE